MELTGVIVTPQPVRRAELAKEISERKSKPERQRIVRLVYSICHTQKQAELLVFMPLWCDGSRSTAAAQNGSFAAFFALRSK